MLVPVIVASIVMCSSRVNAEVLFADDFFYIQPTKTLGPGGGFQRQDYGGGQNGTGSRWVERWLSAGNSIIVGEDVVERLDEFPDLLDTDVHTAMTQGGLSTQFLQRQYQLQGLSDNQSIYFAVSSRTAAEDAAPNTFMAIHAPGDLENQIGFGMLDGGFQAQLGTAFDSDFTATNDTDFHRLIGKLEINAVGNQERLSVWLDPTGVETGGTQLQMTAQVIDSVANLSGVLQLLGAEPRVFWDDVAVGTTWNDVATVNIPRLDLKVDPASGIVVLMNQTSQPFDINYYELLSENASLDPAGWKSLDSQVEGDGKWQSNFGPVDPKTRIVESNLAGGTLLLPGGSFSLGNAFKVNGMRDLVARVGTRDGLLNLASVDYEPISVAGDFNGDGLLTATDIDALTAEIKAGTNSASFDLNADALVNTVDHRVWIKDLKFTWFGDANLDGQFSSTDFVQVFQVGEYEDATAMNSTWAEGDWNGDQDFSSSDFVTAFQDGGFEKGPRARAVAVPEPNSVWLLILHTFVCALLLNRWIDSTPAFSNRNRNGRQ
jgi:hypothetical protein